MSLPLPKAQWLGDIPGHTDAVLQAYGQACRDAALEEAAQICEAIANAPSNCVLTVALNCATAVRGWK